MSADQLFSAATMLASVGWLVLTVGWRWKPAARIVGPVIIAGLLGALYLFLIVAHFGDAEGGFDSLSSVAKLFENRWALLAGWVHYLAFDLFIGAWEARDAQRRGIHFLAVLPCLFLTFMFGPIGLLLYLAIRAAWKRRISVDEA